MNNIDKLDHRIERDFKKCTYIGDIAINDEEYDILKGFLRLGYDRICNSTSHETVDPLFAVALVQIGIRYYDGRFWSYVQKELGLEKLPQNHQNWIGTSFYKTLLQYNKFHVDKSEFMNNILLHCFITKHYANDLFDFLFAYYKIDLDRDLTRNSPDMRNYLMQSMSRGEQSARAYKIKKHTADAVSANSKGCKIRVGRILRFMDNALFNELYPTNSQNRIAQLFCEWAKTSDAFDIEKKRTRGLTHSGEKRFSTPYIHFDINKECFRLLLPQQYIHLENDEEMPMIVWRINNGTDAQEIPARTDVCVTGCKTEKSETIVLSEMLLNEFEIEIWKNGTERIRRFRIRSDSVRFFDSDWDMIDPETYSRYLPVGDAFAFCDPNGILLSDSDSVLDCEKKFGCNLYTLSLKKGDILRLPNGKAKSVGKPLEEGKLSQNLVSGAYAIDADKKYQIYNSVPSVYFRMIPKQENGTLIVVNGERYRFDVEKCVRFDVDEETEEKGYILKLGGLINTNGIYDIIIDVPNSRKERYYSFAFLSGFSYQYENAPYIFQKRGKITFSDTSSGIRTDNLNSENPLQFDFDILPDQDYLSFKYDTATKTINLQIFIPVLKWRFDDGLWNISHPEEIWHKEFPKMIYIKYPDDEITFSMSPIMLETSEEDDENNSFSATFSKNKEKHIFECDTRKMISWLGYEEANRVLRVDLGGRIITFANVITRCFLNGNPIVQENMDSHELIIKSDISGFNNCVADVYYGDKILAEKQIITTSGIHLKVPFKSGEYRIVYYEWDDEDDDFGFADYRKFDEKIVHFESQYDFSGKEFIIKEAVQRKKETSFFLANRYELRTYVKVTNIIADEIEPNVFYGEIILNMSPQRIRIIMCNKSQTQALISYYDEEDDDYFDFLYDKEHRALVITEDEKSDANQKKSRYVFLDSEDFYFNIQIK